MSDLCTPTFSGLAERLGFSCDTAGGLVEFRNPFGLTYGPFHDATVAVVRRAH